MNLKSYKCSLILVLLVVALLVDVFIAQLQTVKMSDLRADGLKGRVKKVTEETADLVIKKGKLIEGPREMSSVVEYDRDGNRLLSDAFSNGEIFLKVRYQVMDGEKVSIDEFISDDDSPPLMAIEEKPSSKPEDPRFSFKYKYVFDKNGNRIEEHWINNKGETWILDKVSFDEKGNVIKQVRRHRGEDAISSITFLKYDEKGRLIETIHADANGKESEKHHERKFDPKGNWVKETVSRKTAKGWKPFMVSYSTFEYFDDEK